MVWFFFGSGVLGSTSRIMGLNNYLNPEEPTFLGLLIMISLYESLKR